MIYLQLMRPSQWWKNSFVFVGLFFGHVWQESYTIAQVLLSALAFCAMSSAVYISNDIFDCRADQIHPEKRKRPIAAGRVEIYHALIFALLLSLVSFALALLLSLATFFLLLLYLLINLAYSIKLKHVVIIDAFVISSGFILRVLAGTVCIGIAPSHWLLLCTSMITLFLAFCKRRAEMVAMKGFGRRVLSQYTPELLDSLIGITAACTILSYSLYTTNPETIRTHQTPYLIATVPLVTYGIFRYMYLSHKWLAGENPARELTDRHILATIAAWIFLTMWLIK